MNTNKALQQNDISTIVSLMRPIEEQSLTSTKNYFSDGTYIREMLIKAGTAVVGKKHKTRHLNILVSGHLSIWTVQGKVTLVGPCIFESLPGVQKVVLAHTDVMYLTIHPTQEKDLDKLEGECIVPVEQKDLFPELDALPLFNKELENNSWPGA